jgi:hypothetical protein
MNKDRKTTIQREFAIVLFILSMIGTLFFGSLDIVFLTEVLTPGYGTFGQYSALSPTTEIISLFIFLIVTVWMIVFSFIFLLKKHYKCALGSGCFLLLFFIFQIWFWTETTLRGA